MNWLDLGLSSPGENLALDEALLDRCEEGAGGEVLRFWEAAQHFVVLGYANAVNREVNTEFCRVRGIPILRRCSGGGTVLQGPGCLNYTLILRVDRACELRSVHGTNDYVLNRHADALSKLLGKPVAREGHTDLALDGLKFSGNAQRRRKNALLFHGSFLLNLDLDLLEEALPLPSKQPDYRLNRSHRDFLTILRLPAASLKHGLREAWSATEPMRDVPTQQLAALVRDKYGRAEWNLKF
ncbi:MAG TPA: lipoate--protein ligase family protein [Verrucomicrobiae bacterium]